MVFTASLLGARHLEEVVESKPASSLDVSLDKALAFIGPWARDAPAFMWKTGGPDTSEMATPKRVWTFRPKYSNTIRFLVNGG